MHERWWLFEILPLLARWFHYFEHFNMKQARLQKYGILAAFRHYWYLFFISPDYNAASLYLINFIRREEPPAPHFYWPYFMMLERVTTASAFTLFAARRMPGTHAMILFSHSRCLKLAGDDDFSRANSAVFSRIYNACIRFIDAFHLPRLYAIEMPALAGVLPGIFWRVVNFDFLYWAVFWSRLSIYVESDWLSGRVR